MASPRSTTPLVLRWACVVAIALGALLRAPALDAGFRDDDYVQRALLEGTFPIRRGPADLFWFAGRDATENARLRDAGYLPWWTVPDLRLSMLRPLSSLLVALDHTLWPDRPYVQHLHSLAWWALLIVAAALVLGRALPPVAAAAACLAYAVEGAHLVPLAWLANRSTFVASAFAMLALWQHLRWRQDGARAAPWLVAVLTTLALCGGEYAFTVLAYVVAYELAARREPLRERARALVPVALPCVAYLGLRAALGHGVEHSGYYVSPLEPAFASVAGPRTAALAADLVFGIPALWFNVGDLTKRLLASVAVLPHEAVVWLARFHLSHLLVGLVAFVTLAALYLWTRRASRRDDVRLGWLVLGALSSLLPAAGALPSDRVLVGASFGVAALIASAGVAAWASALAAKGALARVGAVLLVLACVALHLLLPARSAWQRGEESALGAASLRVWARAAPIPVAGVEDLNVMVVSASDATTATNLPWLRAFEGRGLPRSYRTLSAAYRPHALTRVADDAFELRVLGDPVGLAADTLYRSADRPIEAGFRVRLSGMEVRVLEARGGVPVRTRFVFDEPLDAEDGARHYRLLHARVGGLARVELPRVGETVPLEVAWHPRFSAEMLEAIRTSAAGGSSP